MPVGAVRPTWTSSERTVRVEVLAKHLFAIVLHIEADELRGEWESLPHAERMIWLGCAVERARWLSA